MDALLLQEHPVKEAKIAVRNFDAPRFVDGSIQGKLNPLNKVECDGVFETAWRLLASNISFCGDGLAVIHQLKADVCEI